MKKKILCILCAFTVSILTSLSITKVKAESTLNYNNSYSEDINYQIYRQVKRAIGSADCQDIPNIPTEFGDKVGEPIIIGDYGYQNYEKGYVRVSEDKEYDYIACKNIDKKGDTSLVTGSLYQELIDDVARYVSKNDNDFAGRNDGNDNCGSVIDLREADLNAISKLFKDKYQEFYQNGINIGIKASKVKAWDKLVVCQDYRFGDSSFSFDNDGRRNISIMMYNHKINEVFVVANSAAKLWDKNKELGLPISDYISETVKLPGETEAKEITFQAFEKGFIYGPKESAKVKMGYLYNAETKTFESTPSPSIPSHYGNLEKTIIEGNKTILCYEKGSVVATLNGGLYSYEYHNGRVYQEDGTFKLIGIDQVIGYVGDSFGTEYENQQHIATLLKEKYKKLYNNGYFCGFKESSFSYNWNEVHAQQFIYSDSSACPWYGNRKFVCALVYNQKDDKVVLIEGNALELWNKNYNSFGAPLEDAQIIDGSVYQKFEAGLLIIINNQKDLAFMYEGTLEEYIAGKEDFKLPHLGSTSIVDVPVESNNNTVAIIIITISSVLGLAILASVAVFVIKKRRR